ncbi:MAG: hypothetical protein HC765_14005 [Brachymonas sp.]|nr:hypothetical protein [Brachymonas sp.]
MLYVSGFDPQGAGKYHRIYTQEAKKQCEVSGHRIEVGKRTKQSPDRDAWQIEAQIEGQSCVTDYQFLRWDHIVREHWNASHWHFMYIALYANWLLFKQGVLWRLFKMSRPSFGVCFGPAVVVSGILLAALGLIALLLYIVSSQSGAAWILASSGVISVALWGLWRLSHHAEKAWYMGWVMRSYWFTVKQAKRQTPSLDTQLQAHAEYLIHALRNPAYDEVLVIGHSSGAMVATSLVARACKTAPESMADQRLHLMTLGQCFPILSFPAHAHWFRAEIAMVAQTLGERWVDISAPSDHCCAPLVNPMQAVRALGTDEHCTSLDDSLGAINPKILSPQFSKLFAAEEYAQLKKDLFEMHFQYFKASRLPGWYDFCNNRRISAFIRACCRAEVSA